jgi:hypothetical protein
MKRVKAVMVKKWCDNSQDFDETLYQYLQEKKYVKILSITLFSYWKTIDTEIVPSYAWIQRNTLGYTDWLSKWYGIENIDWNFKFKR